MYELFIYGLVVIGGSWGCPALVGDNTPQGLRAGNKLLGIKRILSGLKLCSHPS